jgi:hypothetical protein
MTFLDVLLIAIPVLAICMSLYGLYTCYAGYRALIEHKRRLDAEMKRFDQELLAAIQAASEGMSDEGQRGESGN